MSMPNQTVDYIKATAPANPKLEIKGLIVQMYFGQSNKTQTEIIIACKEKPGTPSSEEYLVINDEIIKRGI